MNIRATDGTRTRTLSHPHRSSASSWAASTYSATVAIANIRAHAETPGTCIPRGFQSLLQDYEQSVSIDYLPL